MCITTNAAPVEVCTLGEMVPGGRFYLPGSGNFLVTNQPRTPDSTTVVNVYTGRVSLMYSDTKMAFNGDGNLYASAGLNGWYDPTPTLVQVDEANVAALAAKFGEDAEIDSVGRVYVDGTQVSGPEYNNDGSDD